MDCSTSNIIDTVDFSIANNIDDFVTLNRRGEEMEIFYKLQSERMRDIDGAKSLAEVVPEALRHSTLGPFLYEYNAPVCLQTQQVTLDMLKFSYCKGGERASLELQANIFPHMQYAIDFIEEALNHNKDGKITLQDVYDQLTVLNLSNKRISELDHTIAKFKNLQYLNLSWNNIETIEMFQIPPSLFYLNLDMNFLTDVVLCQPVSKTPWLVYLNISRNKISDNSDLRGINSLLNLLMLDLSYNDIHELNTLWQTLQTCMLLSLNLLGNPCSVTKDYFVNVISHMPQLEWLDGLSISNDIKTSILDEKADYCNDAELCINIYRVLQLQTEQSNTLSMLESVPEKTQKSKSPEQLKKRTPKKSRKKKNNKSTVKSYEVPKESVSPSQQPLEIFYRFELECPILDETLHDFVDFVINAENEDTQIPNEILEKMTLQELQQRENEELIILSENEDHENKQTEMTVKEAETLLKKIKLGGSEELNKVFNTPFLSNLLPESPVMEFSPIIIKAPHNNLTLLSNMFYTQLKLHFVQIYARKTKPQVPENQMNQKKRVEKGKGFEPLLKPEIVKRKVLHTIILDQLEEPTWAEESIDFSWTPLDLTRSANLKSRNYRTLSPKSKKGSHRESLPLPEKLTMHFGISLKRAHTLT